jgi:hypothetical protein
VHVEDGLGRVNEIRPTAQRAALAIVFCPDHAARDTGGGRIR